ncbi:hypothetical protein O181_012068 [Austropuccinia psidii MF-1]|uniref:Uncharacterized protein n=1 Tax=Austropuccinia psidii MF-1 TaxID=1389203 RepID=A0A9Q3BW30_9BASI|nr:hypothetical protein [Austropuccinia psidii MF-1]
MHLLISGNIKDYCISFLKVGLTGHELELQRKSKAFLADSNPSKYPFSLLRDPRKRKNEDENDYEKISRPKKQILTKANLSCIWPHTSQRQKCSSEASRTKSDQSSKSNRAKSSRTSEYRYSPRSQKTTSTILSLLPFTHDRGSLVPSDVLSEEDQNLKPMVDEAQRLRRWIGGTAKSH